MFQVNLNFSSFEEIKQYFREQAKKLHPDKGGNREEFLVLLNWYQRVLEKFKEKHKIEVVNKCPLIGNYFFSMLELTVEEIALGGKKKIKVFGEEIICPSCNGKGKKKDGLTKTCGFCKGSGSVEIIDKRRNITTYLNCPYCKGQGTLLIENCENCKGKGKLRIQKEVYIDIPLGLKEGDIIFIPKERIDSYYDLYLEVSIAPHPYFSLKNNNLIYKCKIPFWEVILKKEITIYTLEGKESISSKLFTNSSPIVIKGRGPFLKDGKRGDLLIDFQIYIPEKIPFKAKNLIFEAVKIIKSQEEF
uniref:J domain-containing protein n=1 Tax=Thermodesulfobacterium geofontis TaxID=1295609 RepID=A0A7V6CET9_9BACT